MIYIMFYYYSYSQLKDLFKKKAREFEEQIIESCIKEIIIDYLL